jgi:hypothetical protein
MNHISWITGAAVVAKQLITHFVCAETSASFIVVLCELRLFLFLFFFVCFFLFFLVCLWVSAETARGLLGHFISDRASTF